MALTVETGTGQIAGADSYASVADADLYHSNRANTAWANAQTATKEAALRKATAYLDGRFRTRWGGRKSQINQPLCWPRFGAIDESGYWVDGTTIPQRLRDAVCETALLVVNGVDLNPINDSTIIRQKIDVIETEYNLSEGAGVRFPHIEQLLSDLLGNGCNEVIRG